MIRCKSAFVEFFGIIEVDYNASCVSQLSMEFAGLILKEHLTNFDVT